MRRFVIVFFTVFASLALSSEAAELFTPSYMPYAGMKELSWDFVRKSPEVVRMNSYALFREGVYFKAPAAEEFTFQIEGITYEVFLHKAENHANGSRTWFGKVDGSPFLSHFVSENGRTAGEIWLPTNTPGGFHYSLVPRGGEHYLVQYDEDAIGERWEGDEREAKALFAKSGSSEAAQPDEAINQERRRPVRHPNPCGPGEILTTTVDLMYVYDDTSLTWFGWTKPETAEAELRVLLQNSADDINAAFWNTKVEGYRVNLVAREKVKYASAGDITNDWAWVSTSSEVAALRNTHKADVVGLWVGKSNGLGLSGGFDRGADYAYNVIMVGGGVITARHELGHSLGMGHQPEDWTNPDMPFAYAHYVNLHFRTAVALYKKELCPNFCDTVPIFSNPSVLVDGIPTGIPNERENWRMIALAFPVVAQYRDGSKTACFTKGGTKLAGVE